MNSPFGNSSDNPELGDNLPGTAEDPFADGWGAAPPPGSPFGTTPEHSAPAQPAPAAPPAPAPSEQSVPVATEEVLEMAMSEGDVESVPVTTVNAVEFTPEVLASADALLARLNDDDATEVLMNGPAETLVKIRGQRYHVQEINFPDAATYHQVINEILLPFVDTKDRIDGEHSLIEGQLELPSDDPAYPPVLARTHILAPPLVPFAKVTIAKKARYDIDINGITATGSISPAMADFLKAAAATRLTVVLAGVTGSGKTTLLQAMTHHIDRDERIIVVEDTPELRLPIADVVYLNSTQVHPGENRDSAVSVEFLVKQAQRMRMDRVIVGEVRDGAAYEFLLAANSGAEGSMTSVHADSPRRALDKLLALASRAGGTTSELTIRREIAATVDLLVQTSLVDGRYVVSAIEEIAPNLNSQGMFTTQTLFRFDKARGVHVVENAPSDDLRALMQSRGATMNPAWFPGGLPA